MKTITTETVTGMVNADGTIGRAGPFTARRINTGQVIVQFPGRRLLSYSCQTAGQSGHVVVQGGSIGSDWFGITNINTAWGSVDAPFFFTAILAK
jgi:hypothetical protein